MQWILHTMDVHGCKSRGPLQFMMVVHAVVQWRFLCFSLLHVWTENDRYIDLS